MNRKDQSLEDLFEDDEQSQKLTKKTSSHFRNDEELDDFIVDDENQPLPKSRRPEKRQISSYASSEYIYLILGLFKISLKSLEMVKTMPML